MALNEILDRIDDFLGSKIGFASTLLLLVGAFAAVGTTGSKNTDYESGQNKTNYEVSDVNGDGRKDICLVNGINNGKFRQYLIQREDGAFELTDARGSTPYFKGINFDFTIDGYKSPKEHPFSLQKIPYRHKQTLLPADKRSRIEDTNTKDSVIGSQGYNGFFHLL